MELYLVEHRLPRTTDVELHLLGAVFDDACERVCSRGEDIRYLRSTFLPARERLLSYFMAESAETVRAVSALAQLPVELLERAVDLDLTST